MQSGSSSFYKINFFAYSLVIILSLILTLPSVFFDFVQDDHILIVNNPTITNWRNLDDVLTSDYFQRGGYQGEIGYYRPLTKLSFLIDHTLWGLSPKGFHLSNVLLGVVTSILVYRLALSLVSNPYALIAACLYMAHPGRVQAIGIITARSDLLAALFCVWAAIAWLNNTSHFRSAWRVGIVLFLALLAKEASMGVFVLLGFWSLAGIHGCPERRRFSTWCTLALPFIAYVSLRSLLNISSRVQLDVPVTTALAYAGRTLGFYLRTLFVPIDTAMAPLLPAPSMPWILTLPILALLLIPLWVLRKHRSFSLGASWIVLTIGMLLYPQAIRNPTIEGYLAPSPRFLYMPAIGVALLWTGMLQKMATINRMKRMPVFLGILWFVVMASEFITRLDAVRNDGVIAETVLYDLENVPPSQRSKEYRAALLTHRAHAFFAENRLEEASTALEEALILDPGVLGNSINLAWLWYRLGRDSLAVQYLSESLDPSLRIQWNFDDYTRNYGSGVELLVRLLCERDRCDEAFPWLDDLIRRFPTSWRAHMAMARLKIQRGDTVGGFDYLQTARELAPRGAVPSNDMFIGMRTPDDVPR
jgi:hypothetical protein